MTASVLKQDLFTSHGLFYYFYFVHCMCFYIFCIFLYGTLCPRFGYGLLLVFPTEETFNKSPLYRLNFIVRRVSSMQVTPT